MTAETDRSEYLADQRPQQNSANMNMNNFSFTPEEIRVLSECEKDSFKYRSLPLMVVSGLGVHLAIKNGTLKPNPVLGPYPKLGGAIAFAYMIGRFSYVTECAERVMQLPDSPLGQELRRKKGLVSNVSDLPRTGHGSLEHYQRMDGSKLGSQGVDQVFDSTRTPSGLSAQQAEFSEFSDSGSQPAARSEQAVKKSFEELRNENRLQYAQNKYSKKLESPSNPYDRDSEPFVNRGTAASGSDGFPHADHSPSVDEARAFRPTRLGSQASGRKNAYGDSWEE